MFRLVALAAISLQGPAAPQTTPPNKPADIKEWKVPWENTRPRDPYMARDGRVWFVGQTGHYVGVLDTITGEFKRYDLDPGTGPHTLIVDDAGIVWYAGNASRHIGRLDPATGKITKYPMPDSTVRDPHTMVFDRNYKENGLIFFTAQQGNAVGRFNTKTGLIEVRKTPTANSRPYGIVQDPKGVIWFDQFNSNRIGRLDPVTLELKEFPLPDEKARPRRIALTADGMVWYGDYARGYVGRLDPATGAVKEWPNPGGMQSRPYAFGSDGTNVWFWETGIQPNRLVGFDPRTEQFFSVSGVQSGGGTIRHMFYQKATDSFWFGADAGTIGRAGVAGTKPRPVS